MSDIFDFLIEGAENSIGFLGLMDRYKKELKIGVKLGLNVVLLIYYSYLYFIMGQDTFEGRVPMKLVTYVLMISIGLFTLWRHKNKKEVDL